MEKNPLKKYHMDAVERAESYRTNKKLQQVWQGFHNELVKIQYAYNFFWLGVPILQVPQDLIALQEIIWSVKPDLIIETGIAFGGSLMYSASLLAILEVCDEIENGEVIGIDIEVRPHNRKAILSHPINKKIRMIEGSSIDKEIISEVKNLAKSKKCIMVLLDSNHTHDHVLTELRAYAPLVSIGSYCIVGDTGIEDLPVGTTNNRPWGKGNNPKTAVWEFLRENKNFEIDKIIESKLIITGSPDGYLKRIR